MRFTISLKGIGCVALFGLSCRCNNLAFPVPLQSIQKEDDDGPSKLMFEHGLGTIEDDSGADESDEDRTCVDKAYLKEMVDENLLKLFEGAREFGRETINVRLEMTTTPPDIQQPEIVNLFAFPFLSRSITSKITGYQHRYKRMMDAIANSDWTLVRTEVDHMMMDWAERGWTESTVIAQVLVPCDEIFCVKDAVSGDVIQGHGDEKVRRVVHLVRFEMVVRSYYKDDGSLIPIRNELGKWQITDIDDLLEGNLLL